MFKKKGTLLLLVFLSICLHVFSQKNSGEIRGKAQNELTKSPIEFATVSIFNTKDSTLVTGSITNNKGEFIIKKVPYGNFYIKIDFIGFKTKIINNISLTKKDHLIDIGIISIANDAENIAAFNVVAEKDLMENKIDKKVYNVTKDVSAQGKTGLEVLNSMPSVDVDDKEVISLRGDESVKILIDNRPTNIKASDMLKQIPASSIEKIEIITNPSAKYNPEGMSGIINVILKKEKAAGFNGSYSAGYTYNEKNGYNSYLSLNYRKNKLNFYASGGVYSGNYFGNGVTNRKYFADSLHYQNLTSSFISAYTNIWYTGGINYYLNKSNTIYIEASGWNGQGSGDNSKNYSFLDNNYYLNNYARRVTANSSLYSSVDFDLGWQTKFKKEDHTLDFDIDYTINNQNSVDNINEHFFSNLSIENQLPKFQNTQQPSDDNFLSATLDYTLPINDSLTLEMGLASSLVKSDELFYSESSDSTTIVYPDINLNNHFLYQQNINAFYVTLAKQFNKIGVKLGARIENTTTNSELTDTHQTFNHNYFSYFPSVHLSYQIKEGNEYLLSYSKRINRPQSWDLNPFASYTDPYSLRTGNPFLNPEYIDVYELSYNRYWDKFNFNSSVYYRQVNGKKSSLTVLNSEGISISKPENIADSKINGGELIVGYKPFKWWRTNTSFNIWSSKVKDNKLNQLTSNTFGWMFQLTSTQTIKKSWILQTRWKYRGRSESLQGHSLPRYGLNVSVSKKILKDKGKFTASFNDIFNTRNRHFLSDNLVGYAYETNWNWSSRSVRVSFNYTFGKMKFDSQKREKKSHSANDNLNTGASSGAQGK